MTLAMPAAQMLDQRIRNDQSDQISQLCVPLISRQGGASMPPIGVLKCCNKMEANKVGVPFNDADVRLDVESVGGSCWLPSTRTELATLHEAFASLCRCSWSPCSLRW